MAIPDFVSLYLHRNVRFSNGDVKCGPQLSQTLGSGSTRPQRVGEDRHGVSRLLRRVAPMLAEEVRGRERAAEGVGKSVRDNTV